MIFYMLLKFIFLLIFQGKFDFDISAPHIFKYVNKSMTDRYSNNRYYCHQYFKKFATITEARRHPYRKICREDWEWLCDHFESQNFKVFFLYYFIICVVIFYYFMILKKIFFHEGKSN